MFSFPSGFKCHCSWVPTYHLYVGGSISRLLILPEVSGLTQLWELGFWGALILSEHTERKLKRHRWTTSQTLQIVPLTKYNVQVPWLELWVWLHDFGKKVKGTVDCPGPISLSLFSSTFVRIVEIFTMAQLIKN